MRAPIQSQLRFQMPMEASYSKNIPFPKAIPDIQPAIDISKSIDSYILAEYAPCGVLINDRMEVLQFRGKTSDFLEQPPGEPEANLLKMVREGLFVELQMAIAKARKELKIIRVENVRVKYNQGSKLCNISVRPLNEISQEHDLKFLILFEEVKELPNKSGTKSFFSLTNKKEVLAEDLRSTKLEKELAVTKEYLQSLNDQHQKANDALATANEEFVSGNEELQSMNEELETAKEELQSINEELTTVNDELQNTNQELGQVNNDLINLLNSVQIPIVILDMNRRIRRFTPHARSIMNLLPTDIGRSIDDIKLNLTITDLDKKIAEAMDHDAVKESEVQDRTGKWFRIEIRPYKTLDNKIEGSVISLFDINILKQDVTTAEWARDYASGIVEAIHIPLVVMDKNLKVISANHAFYEIFNVTTSETENNLFYDLGLNQWDIPILKSTLEEVLSKYTSFQNAEIEREFPGLGKRTMSLSAQAVLFENTTSDMILLTIEDVTIRKDQEIEKTRLLIEAIKAKKEIEEASKQLRIIADSVPIHLIHLDRNERFMFLNKAAAKMWGRPIDEMVGKTILEIAGAETQAYLAQYTQQVLAGETVSYESPFTPPGGISLTFLNTYTPDVDSSGKVIGFVATGTDITERIKMEEDLRNSFRNLAIERDLRERFVSALSHDLRTPLSVARLGAEMIVRKISDPAQLHKISDKIIKNMERADGMIRDLLDANRLKAGEKLHLVFKKADLTAVIQEVLGDLKSIHGKRFILRCQDSIMGYWDCDAIRRMLENLASNGIKYGLENEMVTVLVELKDEKIEICVSNKGSPIIAADQLNIFEPFHRSETAAKGAYEGWGIGLTLVRGLARAHGGDVSVTSNIEDGTCFKIILPQDARKSAI